MTEAPARARPGVRLDVLRPVGDRIGRQLRGQRPLVWTALVLALAGLVLPWLEPLMSPSSGAFGLPVWLPGNPLPGVSYGWPVLLGLLAALTGAAIRRRRPEQPSDRTWLIAGGVLMLTAAVGFVLVTCTADAALRLELTTARTGFAAVTRQLGYALPRPQLDHLLFVALTPEQSAVVSALRPGWFCVAAAGLSLLLAATRAGNRQPAPAPVPAPSAVLGGRVAVGLSAVAAGLLLVGVARSVLADRAADDAARLLAQGRADQAVGRYRDALALNPRLSLVAGVATGYGQAARRLGDVGSPYALLARAGDLAAAGEDLQALQTLHRAHLAAPTNALVTAMQTDLALNRAERLVSPGLLAGTLPDLDPDSAAVRLTLGRLELAAGDNPGADADLHAVLPLSPDPDVRSGALTFASIAERRAGRLVEARRTLMAALEADHEDRNLTARSMAVGLFSAKEPG